ncbi:MAG: UDP-glucose/GDP-mannose dehydrogenase family protein, partial [Terriglobales bacterium]
NALWTLRKKRLGVLGLAFKGGTDDVRESPAVAIVESLVAEGCEVQAYDPAASGHAREVLGDKNVRYVASAYEAAENADALLVLTEWNEFRHLDYGRIRQLLRYPILIDGRNLLDPQQMRGHGFTYLSMGRPDVASGEQQVRVASGK